MEETIKDQNRKIRYTWNLIFDHSRLMNQKIKEAGLGRGDVVDADSLKHALEKGVRLTKEEFVYQMPSLLMDYFWTNGWEELSTSGTGTGIPKRVYYGWDDFKRSKEQGLLVFNAMGLRPGDYVLNMFSPDPNSSGPLSRDCGRYADLHMYRPQPGIPLEGLVRKLENDKMIEMHVKKRGGISLWALNDKIYEYGRTLEELGKDPRKFGIKSALTSGSTYTPEKRQDIMNIWGFDVTDAIASTEGSIWGYNVTKLEDDADNPSCDVTLAHVPQNRIFLAPVDQESYNNGEIEFLSPGEKGIDLQCALYDIGEMPLVVPWGISHGDVIAEKDDECPCGRTFQTIQWPVYREDDIIHLAGQNVHPVTGPETAIFDLHFPYLTGVHTALHLQSGREALHLPGKPELVKPYLGIRIETKKVLSETEKEQIIKKVKTNVISNPPAESIINAGSDFEVTFIEREKDLFEGWDMYPQVIGFNQRRRQGKPLKLIRG